MKRAFDIVLSLAGLAVLSPAFLACVLAVRLSSPGPIFFRHSRLGLGGKPFLLLKFRSMLHNAPDIRNADGSAWSSAEDPRVTAVGRFLRRTSLDELPQFVNVLMGDMSLVGPRPDQVDQARFYTVAERRKLEVKPGITGLAQISGRNDIPWEKRKALDVQYVDTRSLSLDVKILALTIPYVLGGSGVNAESGMVRPR